MFTMSRIWSEITNCMPDPVRLFAPAASSSWLKQAGLHRITKLMAHYKHLALSTFPEAPVMLLDGI